MSCIANISNPHISAPKISKIYWGAYLLAASFLALPAHAQINMPETDSEAYSETFPETAPDHTQIRGAQIIAQGVQLSGDNLKAAFSGYVHYGTYILNAQNEITASYSEYHYDDGRIYYTHSDGHNSQGSWTSLGPLICYRYHSGNLASNLDDGLSGGGCYEIYELDECYYFFNARGQYDGYSTRYKIGQEPGRGRAESEPRCIPLIG